MSPADAVTTLVVLWALTVTYAALRPSRRPGGLSTRCRACGAPEGVACVSWRGFSRPHASEVDPDPPEHRRTP